MLLYFWKRYSGVKAALARFVYRAFGFLFRIFPPFIRSYLPSCEKSADVEVNPPAGATCETYTICLLPQYDLEFLGVGASSIVYKVDGSVVLKAGRIFEPPGAEASARDRWHYASDTLFHSNLLQDERTALRLLGQRPHPHIMEAIDIDQPEGIYLRQYQPLSGGRSPDQLGRIQWYRDLTDALCHIHSLGITHADIRVDNVLLDEQDGIILCDFGAASPFGQPNLVFPDLPLPVNGPSPNLSEATDMFALGSFIFEMERGSKPELLLDSNGALILPEIRTGHQGIDMVIRKAWCGQYSRTSEMLEHLHSVDTIGAHGVQVHVESIESLRGQVKKWREKRMSKFGKMPSTVLSMMTNVPRLRSQWRTLWRSITGPG